MKFEENGTSRVEWVEWVPGIICDRRIVARVKAKVHKIIVKPAKMQV